MKQKHIFILGLGIAIVFLLVASTGLVQAQEPQPGGVLVEQSLPGTSFTYQGQLKKGGSPVNDTCSFQFSLYNVASGGTAMSTMTIGSVSVNNGLFTTQIDFGSGRFNGTARWLEIAVECPGDSSYTTLSPRQALTATPYALALPGLWTEQNDTSPNLIGGYSGNYVNYGVVGATISGGGVGQYPNRVTDNYGTVGGGYNNQAGNNNGYTDDKKYAIVGGGYSNTASGGAATVGGGWVNNAGGDAATIGGGSNNTANGTVATVSGGKLNDASGDYAIVGGGYNNDVSDPYATIGGGKANKATDQFATIGGGELNIANGSHATVGGGFYNIANYLYTTVSGGLYNHATGLASTVGGGSNNEAAGNYSFVVGYKAQNYTADHPGVFLFADSTNQNFYSAAANEFAARANGGFRFVSSSGTCTTTGGGWSCTSDRNAKANFVIVDGREVLLKVASLPIQTWNFKDNTAIRHMGPMAQDFYSAFGLGQDDKTISTIDLDGVALASIQGLYHIVQEKDAEIATLKAKNAATEIEIAALKAENAKLDDRITAIEQALQANVAPVRAVSSIAILPQGWNVPFWVLVGMLGLAVLQRVHRGGTQ